MKIRTQNGFWWSVALAAFVALVAYEVVHKPPTIAGVGIILAVLLAIGALSVISGLSDRARAATILLVCAPLELTIAGFFAWVSWVAWGDAPAWFLVLHSGLALVIAALAARSIRSGWLLITAPAH